MTSHMELKHTCSLWWGRKNYNRTRQHIKKQRRYFTKKGPYSQNYGFTSSHVWIWKLDHKESWVPKNWCFWTMMLEKTLGSPLDSKESKPVSKSCLALWDPMDWRKLGFPVFHHLLKFAHVHVHWFMMPSNHLILCYPLLLLPQSFSASGSLPKTKLSVAGGQSIRASASASVLPTNIHSWFLLELTGFISLQSKGFSRVFFNTTVQNHQFLGS